MATDRFPICAPVTLFRPPLFGSPRAPVQTTIEAIIYDDKQRPLYVRTAEEKNRWFMADTGRETGPFGRSRIEVANG